MPALRILAAAALVCAATAFAPAPARSDPPRLRLARAHVRRLVS